MNRYCFIPGTCLGKPGEIVYVEAASKESACAKFAAGKPAAGKYWIEKVRGDLRGVPCGSVEA